MEFIIIMAVALPGFLIGVYLGIKMRISMNPRLPKGWYWSNKLISLGQPIFSDKEKDKKWRLQMEIVSTILFLLIAIPMGYIFVYYFLDKALNWLWWVGFYDGAIEVISAFSAFIIGFGASIVHITLLS